MKQTKVVFRTYKDGQVIALFPYDIQNMYGDCQSYMHLGQHGLSDYLGVMSQTVRSTPEQRDEMKTTLERLGYKNIVEIKRINAKESQKANEEFRLKRKTT